MLSIDKVTAIAEKAKLNLSEDELIQMSLQMSDISIWLEKLNDIDTEGVEPLTDISGELNN